MDGPPPPQDEPMAILGKLGDPLGGPGKGKQHMSKSASLCVFLRCGQDHSLPWLWMGFGLLVAGSAVAVVRRPEDSLFECRDGTYQFRAIQDFKCEMLWVVIMHGL